MLKKVFMLKKVLSFLCLLVFFSSNHFAFVGMVSANASPWTYEKARHLGQRVLFGPTEGQVQELFNAGSAVAAVDILFPSENGPDRTAFQAELEAIIADPNFNGNSNSDIYSYYSIKKGLDPYPAKAKLFSVIEDTFSVNKKNTKELNFFDIENTHTMLYSHTLGNYKEMIQRNLYNNGSVGDYSLGKFLDLFNQKRPNNPNENYSRELLQLLLMEEYLPTKGADVGGLRNYSETDVNLLAKILVGFEMDENTHAVSYNPAVNTNLSAKFLSGALSSGDSYPFYDLSTGMLDIQALKTPINGNNGLPDNIIDFIFSKREEAISLFLANKIFRFYIHETPTFSELETVATILKNNNFELLTSIKQILSLDVVYSEASMIAIMYKNPLELVVGTHNLLGVDEASIYPYALQELGWTPYYAGSVFGRDGFDTNENFFSAYTSVKWQATASRIIRDLDVASFVDLSLLDRGSLVTYLEDRLYLGKRLPNDVQAKLITFLGTSENAENVVFDLNDTNYQNIYVKSVILLMLLQPEYILKSGNALGTIPTSNNDSFYGDSDSKLIILKNYGGADWLHYIIPKNEYAEYLEKRGDIALPESELLSLNDDYYIHPKLLEIKALFDSGDLKIINRVGTTNHSRSHSAASNKMASLNNTFVLQDKGILGGLIENELASKTIVMGNQSPSVLRGGKYINLSREPYFSRRDSVSSDFFDYRIGVLKNIGENRDYPADSSNIFKTAYQVDQVGKNIKDTTGRSSIGGNMADIFGAAESVLAGDLANVLIMRADGGYDTHRNQIATLNRNLENVSKRTAAYFNAVKDTQDITLLFYSEFGRTLKANSSDGTDHGKGGGMLVFTNNAKLKAALPEKIYGNNSFKNAQANRLGVGIDYRSVYATVYQSLYNKDVSSTLGADYKISNYIDTTPAELDNTRIRFSDVNRNNESKALLGFDILDSNFINAQGSHISVAYGTDSENLRSVSRNHIDRYMDIYDHRAEIDLGRVRGATRYFYKVVIYDNQYNAKTLEGSFIAPREVTGNNGSVNTSESTRFDRYKNRQILGTQMLDDNQGKGLSLSGTILGESDIKLLAGTGGYITQITSSSGTTIWDGSFMVPKKINVDNFLRSQAGYNGVLFSNMNIDSLVKVGAGNIGLGMKLNKQVTLEVPLAMTGKTVAVLSSEDGISWTQIAASDVSLVRGAVMIQTNHFSYFMILEAQANGSPLDLSYVEQPPEPIPSRGGGGGGGGGGYSTKVGDLCPTGDFTNSRYDNKCGIDPDIVIATAGLHMDSEFVDGDTFPDTEINNMTKHSSDETERNQLQKSPKIIIKKESSSRALKKAIIASLYAKLEIKKIGNYTLYNLKGSDKNTDYNSQALGIIQSQALKSKKNKLISQLKNVVILEGLLTLEGLPEKLYNKISTVNQVYQASFKREYKKIMEQKYGSQTNDIPKQPAETIREKIIRLNKQKANKKENEGGGTEF